MTNWKAPITALSLALLASGTIARAAETPTPISLADYGSLYVDVKRDEHPSNWRASASYSYELSNPFLNLHGFTGSFQRFLGRYALLGGQLTGYASNGTDLMRLTTEQLSTQSIQQVVERPAYSAFVTATVVPLSGYLDFFGNKPLEMEISVTLGVGLSAYHSADARQSLLWSVRPAAFLSRHWSIEAGIGQEIESVFDSTSLVRLQGTAGLAYQF
jgi:hypothetical protein